MSRRTSAALIELAAGKLAESPGDWVVVFDRGGFYELDRRLHPSVIVARAACVRESNKGLITSALVIGVQGETYTIVEALQPTEPARFLSYALYVGPAIDPEAPESIVVPKRRHRRSPLAGRCV